MAAAFAAGVLSSWWAHRRTAEATSESNERTIVRLRRSFVALVIFVGAYLAIEMAPLPSRLSEWLAGAAFILGALACARLMIARRGDPLISSSVTHIGGQERARLEREYVPLAEKATSLAVWLHPRHRRRQALRQGRHLAGGGARRRLAGHGPGCAARRSAT